jgi:hypothetical protein
MQKWPEFSSTSGTHLTGWSVSSGEHGGELWRGVASNAPPEDVEKAGAARYHKEVMTIHE